MPRPAYIVCSLSGAADQFNSSVSCFSLVEAIQFAEIPLPQQRQRPDETKSVSLRVSAAWFKEEQDAPDQAYQAQLILRLPNQQQEIVLVEFNQFCIAAIVHRLIAPEIILPRLAPGFILIECRIRRCGEDHWLSSQSYPILAVQTSMTELGLATVQSESPETNPPTR